MIFCDQMARFEGLIFDVFWTAIKPTRPAESHDFCTVGYAYRSIAVVLQL